VWLPKYQKNWLRFDIIAGITVLALLIPEGMAYAELAGLPPETVFYGAPAALIAYAIFGVEFPSSFRSRCSLDSCSVWRW
jgi:MFS superfamily sulfate permease-like transporter